MSVLLTRQAADAVKDFQWLPPRRWLFPNARIGVDDAVERLDTTGGLGLPRTLP